MSPADKALVSGLAGRYRIERELGAGGMATVHLAEDVKHRRRVALKVLKPELAAVVGADRFLKEIEVTANLQHPNIVPLFDSGEVAGQLYCTAGRTPSIWSADVRTTYELPARAAGARTKLLLDVQNLGNQRRAIDFEQLHYFNPAQTSVNPNYLKVNRYQTPLTARLGVLVGF